MTGCTLWLSDVTSFFGGGGTGWWHSGHDTSVQHCITYGWQCHQGQSSTATQTAFISLRAQPPNLIYSYAVGQVHWQSTHTLVYSRPLSKTQHRLSMYYPPLNQQCWSCHHGDSKATVGGKWWLHSMKASNGEHEAIKKGQSAESATKTNSFLYSVKANLSHI